MKNLSIGGANTSSWMTSVSWAFSFSCTLLFCSSISVIGQDFHHALEGQSIRSYAVNDGNDKIILLGMKGAAGDGKVMISTDAGTTWGATNQNNPLCDSCEDVQAVSFIDDQTYIAGTWKNGLYLSTDAGQKWSKIEDFPADDIRSISPDYEGKRTFLATTTHGVLIFDHETKKWSEKNDKSLPCWHIEYDPNSKVLFGCTFQKGLYTWTEKADWAPSVSYPGIMFYDVAINAANNIYAVGCGDSSNIIIGSQDGGKTWLEIPSTTPASFWLSF